MNDQNIEKYQQKELNFMRKICKKTRNYISLLWRVTNGKKIEMQKRVNFLLRMTKLNQIQQDSHSFTITDNI